MNLISPQDKLNIVLKEYEALRNEIIRFSDRQLQLFYFLLLVLTFVYGYVITNKVLDILSIVPLLVSPFVFRYMWDQYNVLIISEYLKEIEHERIPSLVGYMSEADISNHRRYWLGWQHYWENVGGSKKIRIINWYDKHLALLWIILVSFVPSIVYSLLVVVSSLTPMIISMENVLPSIVYSLLVAVLSPIKIEIRSFIPAPFHMLLLIFYVAVFLKILKDKSLRCIHELR